VDGKDADERPQPVFEFERISKIGLNCPKRKIENIYFLTSKNSEKFKSDRFDEK
jgi:hypothetical protein